MGSTGETEEKNDGDELTDPGTARYRFVGELVLGEKKETSSIGNRSSRSVVKQRDGRPTVQRRQRQREKTAHLLSREIAFLQFLGGLSAPSTADCRYR